MDTTTIIMIIAGSILILTNLAMIIMNIQKRKNSGEITMDVEDYLTLILQQLDQIAQDALSMTKIDPADFSTEKEYHLAVLKIAKERLFECGEEYGLSPSIIKLIDTMKLDRYLLDAVTLATKKEELKAIEEAESDPISTTVIGQEDKEEPLILSDYDFTDAASQTMSDEETKVEDIGDAISGIYDNEE